MLRLIVLRLAAEPPVEDTGQMERGEEPLTVARALWNLLQERSRDADDPHHVFALLTGLAFSRGAGLPWASGLWPGVVAGAFGLRAWPTDQEERRVLDIAAPLVAEGVDPAGRSAYRLHHESYAEVLREAAPQGTGSVTEETTDQQGGEIFTLRVPCGGELYLLKISRWR
ncbi:hypothetical protein [Streptomyces sp. NBC_01538]|uniref:hypothetical protein n=1 Tax=Streptomyces sp. NBC_01538 TaxID=2903897 RepID=UPI003865433B